MVDKTTDQRHTFSVNRSTYHLLSHPILLAALAACAFLLVVICPSYSQEARILFHESFANLDNWRALHFPKVSKHSTYEVEPNGEKNILKTESDASASALVHKREFNVYDYPSVRWRWRVNNVYNNVDPEKKSGDDYPIRVYIIFKYNPETAGAMDRAKYGLARKLYGEYPPHSSLNYVWANSTNQKAVIANPYTDKAKLIALKRGNKDVGAWRNEEINILEDYRVAFGIDPPAVASIAIMNDSDDSGQKSVSYLDFIEVFAVKK
jgi:hypothetical protein